MTVFLVLFFKNLTFGGANNKDSRTWDPPPFHPNKNIAQ